jgi:hypothetical protein
MNQVKNVLESESWLLECSDCVVVVAMVVMMGFKYNRRVGQDVFIHDGICAMDLAFCYALDATAVLGASHFCRVNKIEWAQSVSKPIS